MNLFLKRKTVLNFKSDQDGDFTPGFRQTLCFVKLVYLYLDFGLNIFHTAPLRNPCVCICVFVFLYLYGHLPVPDPRNTAVKPSSLSDLVFNDLRPLPLPPDYRNATRVSLQHFSRSSFRFSLLSFYIPMVIMVTTYALTIHHLRYILNAETYI